MNCQNCEAVVPSEAEHCEKCGARLLYRRVVFGAPRAEEFRLTSEAEFIEADDSVKDDADWQFPARSERSAVVTPAQVPDELVAPLRYGGFFRRFGAFVIDCVAIFFFAALLAVMALIGYKVGLAAHGRSVSWDNAPPLIFLLTFGWILLAATYFVVFHGMEGKTIGKSLFGLRVVGLDHQAISYRRALLRWIVFSGFGCATIGLCFLWILWSPEKRGWHDLAARTWVIRD